MTSSTLSPALDVTRKVVEALAASPQIAALITNDPDAAAGGEPAPDLIGSSIFDYMPVSPGDSPTGDVLIGVETELLSRPTATMQEWQIRLGIFVRRSAMEVDQSLPGGYGNRRDRLVAAADALLSGSREFGVGILWPESCETVEAPDGFSGRETLYRFSRPLHPGGF